MSSRARSSPEKISPCPKPATAPSPPELRWTTRYDTIANIPPARGTPEEMKQILEQFRNLVNGFGLAVKNHELVESPLPTSNHLSPGESAVNPRDTCVVISSPPLTDGVRSSSDAKK
jgi:hypothetical protein